MTRTLLSIWIITICILKVNAVDLLIRPNTPVCTSFISSFDPIKVEVKVPTIGAKVPNEMLTMTLFNQVTEEVVKYQEMEDGKTYRHNFLIEHNTIHRLCFELVSSRELREDNFFLISYSAQEHFEDNIEKINIPSELLGETKLRNIYETGYRMREFIEMSTQRQKKERQVEDRMVDLSSHKAKRIITITVIECAVILMGGVYQVLALRKFLIDRSLY